MKKQFPTAGPSPAYGYPPPSRGPQGGGNLPRLFENQGCMMLPLQRSKRPPSGLKLDVQALGGATGLFLGAPAPPPRTREGERLSSSDCTSDRVRRSATRGEGQGRLTQRRNSQPAVSYGAMRGVVPVPTLGGGSSGASPLAPLTRRLPSARHNTLPPIGAEPSDSHVTEEEGEEEEEESLFGAISRQKLEETEVGGATRSGSDDESDSESDDEDFLETESEAPPSRPGFESEAEKSAEMLQIPFPDVNISFPFPATLIQQQNMFDGEKCAVHATTTGLSPRVNNIVRAFNIHGPLDRELLSQALNKIVNFHPLLLAKFQQAGEQLYVQVPKQGSEQVPIVLESPVVGHEQPEDLILNARRKIFTIPMSTDITAVPKEEGEGEGHLEGVASIMSLTSVGDGDFSAENSPQTAPHKRVVSFATEEVELGEAVTERGGDFVNPHHSRHAQLPSLAPIMKLDKPHPPLIRARLVSKMSTRHILVLSFPRLVCDYFSSCLLMQQLTDLYSRLEKNSHYKPSMAAKKLENKRKDVLDSYEREKKKNAVSMKTSKRAGPAARLLLKRQLADTVDHIPMVTSKVKFPQVAQREKQLLMMFPRDRLLGFWEGVVTATIRRERGTNRTKVVPPVRIPSGLGEVAPLISSSRRPQTSRLRPLTAARARPPTARRQGGGAFGEVGFPREALLGPKTSFHFIKIEDEVCEMFQRLLPETCQSAIQPHDQFRLFALGTYLLLLARCCRGWGSERHISREHRTSTAKVRGPVSSFTLGNRDLSTDHAHPIAVGEGYSPHTRREQRGARLDVGSFLIGVEVSLRECEPNMTHGLLGPLTNDAAIRVNLSSSGTFAELVIALSKSLQAANKHGHLPFAPVAEEVGLPSGLPVKFCYLRHDDVIQMANPNTYFYTETALGVVDQGLSRLGSNCYLKPLNSKMDDTCHLELSLWESYDHNTALAGGIRYQPQVIKPELVESFGKEFCRLLKIVSFDPSARLLELAREIRPPFLSSRSKTRGGRGLNRKF